MTQLTKPTHTHACDICKGEFPCWEKDCPIAERFICDECADDAKQTRTIDLREGTAEYMSKMGTSLSLVGCNSSEEELFKRARKILNSWTLWFNKAKESYTIGFMTGLLLQMRRVDKWQEKAMSGEDLLNILLHDVRSRPRKENKKLANKFREFYETRNVELAGTIEYFVSKLKSTDYYVVAIPNTWSIGPYNTKAHINFIFGGITMTLALQRTASFEKRGTSVVIELHEQDAGFIKLSGTMAGDYTFFPIAVEHLKKEFDGSYSIFAEHVTTSPLILVPQRLKGFTAVWLIAQ